MTLETIARELDLARERLRRTRQRLDAVVVRVTSQGADAQPPKE